MEDLINRMHNHLIEIVTGIRRSGKSQVVFGREIPGAHIIWYANTETQNKYILYLNCT